MAEQLSEHALETTLRVARVMFPHDDAPRLSPTPKCRRRHSSPRPRPWRRASPRSTRAPRCSSTSTRPTRRPQLRRRARASDVLRAAQGRPPSSSSTTTRSVWKAFGYEGPSVAPRRLPRARLRRPRLAARPAHSIDPTRIPPQPGGSRCPAIASTTRTSSSSSAPGAGGGTLANELCQKGVKVVVLEAGRHHTPEDFVNDEWRSFKQLAWLDNRTTSGSFRIAQATSPTCRRGRARPSAARRRTGPAAARASWSTSSRPRPTTGGIEGVNALDWPISLADVEPYYDRAETEARHHGHQRHPAAAGQQQLQGVRQRRPARRLPALPHRPLRRQPGAV